MRILHRYIASSFITTFLLALLILSFVMSVALIFKVTQYIARGMSIVIVLEFFKGALPGTLSYSIPIAALVTTILVFGRLSGDSEISAMLACGVSLAQIMRTPVLMSLLLSFFCLYLNNDLSPDSSFIRSTSRKKLKVSDVTAFIEPGRFVELGEHSVYVGSQRDNELEDLRILETLDNGTTREIRAKKAIVITTNDVTSLDMRHVTMDPAHESTAGIVKADRWVYRITEPDAEDSTTTLRKRRVKDEYTWVLVKNIIMNSKYPNNLPENKTRISRTKMEITSRISLAFACFCFVIVAAPLGIKRQRQESSIGIAICLATAGSFYLFNIAGDSMANNPAFHAHHMAWIPIIASIVISIVFTLRNN
ncbi:MAG: YjgP/YjgQ family permease [Lentisphaerae bacterium]|jgi:lipopolysaccharide export LptBFGC system permease protein LptF|nr:YjgP/YjgQ family permease [Lentisphaerota bacterium]